MQKYTVQMLEKAVTTSARDYITIKELWGLRAKYLKLAKEGPAEAVTAENHLRLIEFLVEIFQGTRKIPIPALRAATDSFLRDHDYVYSSSQSPAATVRRVYSDDKGAAYDLAFYSPLATWGAGRGHHNTSGGNSLFYSRVERQNNTIVLGNLQLDVPGELPPEADGKIKLLLRRKNLYRTMVYETLRHALTTGVERIIFQAGSAAAWAQWQTKVIQQKTIITKENYTFYRKKYEELCVEFEKISPGLYACPKSSLRRRPYPPLLPEKFTGDEKLHLLVYEKTPDRFSGRLLHGNRCEGSLVDELSVYYVIRAQESKEIKFEEGYKLIHHGIEEIYAWLKKNEPAKILAPLDKIFSFLDPKYTPTRSAEKIEFLKNLPLIALMAELSTPERHGKLLEHLDSFLERFGYDKIALAACPEIKVNELDGMFRGKKRLYVDTSHYANYKCYRKNFVQPKLGQNHCQLYKINPGEKPARMFPGYRRVYEWYETGIPKILSAAGLGSAKSPL